MALEAFTDRQSLKKYSSEYGIGIVGLSMPLEKRRRQFVEEAIQLLRNEKFEVTVGKTAFSYDGYKTATTEQRVEDLINMFQDKNVNLILNVTGGFSSNDLLESLDYEEIEKHPKWFVGYSDITALNLALYTRSRLQTVNGQMLVDYGFDRLCFNRLFATLQSGQSTFDQPETVWESFWEERLNTERPCGPIQTIEGKKEQSTGVAIAGNLSTLGLLMGTPYFRPQANAVYFLEYDKEEKSSLPAIERYLRQMKQCRLFENAKGLVFGVLEKEVMEEERSDKNLKKILSYITEDYEFPVLYNAGFGHNYPAFPIINGQNIQLIDTKITSTDAVRHQSL